MSEFHWEYYKHLNPDLFWLDIQTPKEYYQHYLQNCTIENRKSSFRDIFPDFDWLEYKIANPQLSLSTQDQLEYHYFTIGRNEDLPTKCPELSQKINLFMLDNPQLQHIGIITKDDYLTYYKKIEVFKPEYKNGIKKPTLGFFLIGFGQPFLDKKIAILKKNLQVLQNIKKHYDIDLYIYIYSTEHGNILNSIDFTPYVNNVFIKVEKGIIGEFIYKYVSNLYKLYDYIMLFLDDIEFSPIMDIQTVLKVYELEQLDILGFPLTRDSPTNHLFMYTLDEPFTYRETNFIEFFSYFISQRNFPKYLQFYNKFTRWCWGIDISLHPKGLRLGILELYPIRHYFKAKSYNSNLPNPVEEWIRYKNQYVTIRNKMIIKKEKY